MTVLDIQNLNIRIAGRTLVDDLSLHIDAAERVGLIGESGSGKSLTCMAVLGLLPDGAEVSGSIRFEGHDLVGAGDRVYRALRGSRIGCVFQEPQTALDPLQRVGPQITSALRARRRLTRSEAREIAVRLADDVGLPDPERIVRRYPHELSGGQRQRVVIAMAMAASPALLLADEPTTALDVTVQARILELLGGKLARERSSLLLVTHDMAVAANICDRLAVMRHGRIVEQGATRDILANPRHAYTAELVEGAYATSWRPARVPASPVPAPREHAGVMA
jgi:peptide/nickel transport system ATP-binding protein